MADIESLTDLKEIESLLKETIQYEEEIEREIQSVTHSDRDRVERQLETIEILPFVNVCKHSVVSDFTEQSFSQFTRRVNNSLRE